ncbi:putative Rossmann fold nucleotide-binding protein [Cyanobium gracile PCC 6307]|uniref:Putative Rossmann fold nucleotide-binding protein n=2 Tax=Cyanobium gracile TaxID=59930 RepID=K9P3T6_CYAGP|nr:putative Rossmann fold nucleotide-binding protein [Cyanobium gracile PCC 6307]
MGAGDGASPEAMALAEELGECISARGWVLLTGGRPAGVMAAASRGAARVEGHLVVGVLPDEGNEEERQHTAELDLAVFTGMGKARNVINVLSADVVVICGGGGPGTASEAAHALNGGRPLILLAVPPLWRDFFCSLGKGVECASDVDECCRLIEARLQEA